jgi:hypothetical protein
MLGTFGRMADANRLQDWERAEILRREIARKDAFPKEPESNYYVGLDLGKINDPSALVVDHLVGDDPKRREHRIVLIERYLDVPYPAQVERVVDLFSRPPLTGGTLVVDQTGVGVAVVDFFQRARPRCSIRPIMITGGSKATVEGAGWHVPKRELVGILNVLLGTGRLLVSKHLPDAAEWIKELHTFTAKVNKDTGNETLESYRTSDKDDVVLAVSMACWAAERGRKELWVR